MKVTIEVNDPYQAFLLAYHFVDLAWDWDHIASVWPSTDAVYTKLTKDAKWLREQSVSITKQAKVFK